MNKRILIALSLCPLVAFGVGSLTKLENDLIVSRDQASTPSNPVAGKRNIYTKADGKLYILNSTGTEKTVGVDGPSSSVDSELALFSGVSGNVVKRATGTGFVKSISGVASFSSTVDASTELANQVPMANGGTNKNMIPIAGGVVWTDADSMEVISAGTSGQLLASNGSAAPSWTNISGIAISSLNGLTANSQTFATGSTGTDFNISSSTSTHTFNIPTASATNRGLLSSSDWSTFNNKQSAITQGNLTEATSSVLTITGGTSAVIGSGTSIQVKQASTSQAGYLSSTDWNTFNDKVTGQASSVDSEIALFSGTGGKTIKRASSTGILRAASGVLNADSYTSNYVILGNGTSAFQTVAPSTSGNILTSNGTTWVSSAPVKTYVTSSISASNIDWSLGEVYTKTLGANTTFTFSNLTSGKTIVVRITNTASNYTVTWPTVKWSGGTAPTQTIGAKSDVYTFVYDGTDVYGSVVQNF